MGGMNYQTLTSPCLQSWGAADSQVGKGANCADVWPELLGGHVKAGLCTVLFWRPAGMPTLASAPSGRPVAAASSAWPGMWQTACELLAAPGCLVILLSSAPAGTFDNCSLN